MSAQSFLPPRSFPFDPPKLLSELRATRPISKVTLWDGREVWLITRYADARAVLADVRFSADTEKDLPALSPGRANPRPQMSRMDDPRHGEIRRLLADEFVASRADRLRGTITEIVESQLDDLLARTPPVDLHAAFALPVPSRLVSHLLGVSLADHRTFQRCTSVLVSRVSTKQEFTAADDELYALCVRLIDERLARPADDLLGRFVVNGVLTGRLSREEACLTAKLLIVGGHETTANMISMSALTMILHPAWAKTMREEPDMVRNAVEELLRYHTPMHDGVPRVALEDVMVSGTLIRAGEGVIVSLASGNRDADVFAFPDELDMDRPEARHHLTFGHGIHNCLGKWLARAELRIALPALARRIPTLDLAVPFADIRFKWDSHIYGVHALPVTW